MTPATNRTLFLIAVLAVGGVAVSSVALYHHYDKSPAPYCTFGQTFNCDIVNRSVYSVVLGVPVALIGVIGYLTLLSLATLYRTKGETPLLLLIGALGGLAFALYFAYIEAFVLAVWCILCLCSLGIILAISVTALLLVRRTVTPSADSAESSKF